MASDPSTPATAHQPRPARGSPADPRDHDRFHIQQRFRPMVNQYEVATLAADGRSPDRPVCFVEQRRMTLKEDLRAFVDDSKSQEVFRIKARQVWDPAARYKVTDPSGQHIGELGKAFGRSLLRSTWEIFDPAGTKLAWAQERSLPVALLRRAVHVAPLVENFASWLPIPFHFELFRDRQSIGGLRRILGLRDRYVLELSGDPGRTIDRRVALALAVGMDALQAR